MDALKVMITGHRPDKIRGHEEWIASVLHDILSGMLRRNLSIEAISGMALGVDTIYAEAALSLSIPMIAAVPFIGQESRWSRPAQERYKAILACAKDVVIVSEGSFASWKFLRRNTWMVEQCNVAIAVWDGSSGGTRHAVSEILRLGRKGIRVDPILRTIGVLAA